MKSTRATIAGLVLLAAAPARAESALTLDGALDLARRNNRDLRAARARLEQSASSVEQAWAALLPTVSAQGKYTHNYKEVTLDFAQFNQGVLGLAGLLQATATSPAQAAALGQFQQTVNAASAGTAPIEIQKMEQLDASLTASVPLLSPSAYPALRAAKKSQASAEAGYAVNEAQLMLSVAQSFYAAAGNDELVAARRHAVDVARRTRDDAESRFQSGMVNRVEVMRAQLALERAEQVAREADDARAQAYRALATLLCLRDPFRVLAGEPPPPRVATGEAAQLALSLRPELAQYARSVEAARAQVDASRWRWAPTLSAFGNVRGFNYKGFSGDNYSWAAGLEVDWVLYDGGARDAAAHLAAAQRRENEARFELERDTVVDEVANADRALGTRRHALSTAQNAVQLSRDTLDLVRAQHDAGTATQLDLLQAQDALVAAEVSLAQARFDLALADLNLQRATGTFPRK